MKFLRSRVGGSGCSFRVKSALATVVFLIPCAALLERPARGACIVPPSGLVSWWSGDDTGYDLAGFNHGVLKSGARYADGKVGRGFSFDGTTNYVQTTTWGMNLGVLDFSIVGWAKTIATKQYSTLVEFDFYAPALYITGANGGLQLYPASGTTVGGFNDGQFHHFAVARVNGIVNYYKDGVLIGTAAFSGVVNQARFLIGSDTLPSDAFAGVIDEVAFYERALSTNEIAAMFAAGTAGMCKPTSPISLPFFIEAEDFDFGAGQHKSEADSMPYLGGAYAGLSATAEIDYHDPGGNENVDYRPADQGVAMSPHSDISRDCYLLTSNYKVGWNDPGDWYNYTRVFPAPARSYNIYARLAGGNSAVPTAIQVDEVVSGAGTANQTLVTIGQAIAPASGSWDYFLFVPVRDSSSNLVTVNFGGQKTVRITVLAGGQEDINYLQFVPVDPPSANNCVATASGLVGWWPGDGHAKDLPGANPGTLQNGATYITGKVGESFVFDGVNDYVDTALDVQPSAMPSTTWECWVYPMRIDGSRYQILSSDDGGYDRSLEIESGNFGVFVGFGVWMPVGITPNQWQHVAVVYSPNNVEFYKNGRRFSFNGAPTGGATANRLQIGRNPGFGEYFLGRIDEVSIYNRALSAAEIQAIYTAGSAGKCKLITPCPIIALSPPALAGSAQDRVYSQTFTAANGIAPYVFSLASGALPPGLSLSSNGVLSGLLTSTGTFSFSIRASDNNGCSTPKPYSLLVTNGAPPPCLEPPSGLVSWWRAEDQSARDTKGVNPGGLSNGVSFAAGRVGQGFSFDGIDDFVQTPTNGLTVGTADFSIEGWAKTAITNGSRAYQVLFSFGNYEPALYIRYWGGMEFLFYPRSVAIVDKPVFNDGQFHHFAAVRQSGTISFYLDGEFTVSAPFASPIQRSPFYIGKDGGGTFFPGVIDELSFYRRALSSNEVRAIYSALSAGKCGPTCLTISLSPGTLPNGALNSAYNQTITASGGIAPYTVSSSGTLPPGLGLSTAGVLSGTLTATGTFSFVITATDATNCIGTQPYTVTILKNDVPVVLRALEAVQVSQDWENSVPLIANKPTLIRAHLQLEGASTGAVTVAGARLHGRKLGSGATASWAAINPAGQLTVLANDTSAPSVRSNLNNSLNFMLPADWVTEPLELGLEWSNGVLICREPAETGGMVNDCVLRVTFTNMPALPVKFIRVAWSDGSGTHVATPANIDEQKLRLISIYPIASMVSLDNGFLTWSAADGAPRDENRLLMLINDLRITSGDTRSNSPIYYGVVSNVMGFRGLGYIGLGAAHGAISRGEFDYQRHLAAHEIGHTLKRHHAVVGGQGVCNEATDNMAPDFPMDNHPTLGRRPVLGPLNAGPDRQIWGYDHYSRTLVSPYSWFDVMSYCLGGDASLWPWMSKYTYTNIQNRIINLFGPGGAPGPAFPAGAGDYVLVRGEVSLNSGVVNWLPFYPFESHTPPTPPQPGDYTLVLLNQAGVSVMEIPFALDVPPIEFNSVPNIGSFAIPVPANPAIVRAVIRRQGAFQAEIEGSANAPTVQLLAPVGGEVFGNETITVRWTASDLDLDPLWHLVQFSPDAGVTWQTIAIDWNGRSYDIPSDTLPATAQGRMRVIASDGFRSDSDESPGTFVVGNHTPAVAILTPDPGQVFSADQTIVLQASANDLDDGRLSGPSVQWRSDRDGALGAGEMLLREASTLSEGRHLIAITATDSGGLNSSASVTIHIVREPPPTLHITRVQPQVQISWDAPATGYVLEVTGNLSSDNWTRVSQSPMRVGAEWVVNIPPAETSRFYRLVKR